jgi:hypothetical protein
MRLLGCHPKVPSRASDEPPPASYRSSASINVEALIETGVLQTGDIVLYSPPKVVKQRTVDCAGEGSVTRSLLSCQQVC